MLFFIVIVQFHNDNKSKLYYEKVMIINKFRRHVLVILPELHSRRDHTRRPERENVEDTLVVMSAVCASLRQRSVSCRFYEPESKDASIAEVRAQAAHLHSRVILRLGIVLLHQLNLRPC